MSDDSQNPMPASSARLAPERMAPARRTIRRSLLLVMLIGVVGPCIAVQAPREVGRWKLAAAMNLRNSGKSDAAYERLAETMRWFPDNPRLLLQRAEWRLADGEREEAIADCDKMLEAGGDELAWQMAYGQFMWDAGEFGRAVGPWRTINDQSQRTGRPPREAALNGLAYALALAKVELEEALTHANQALNLQPDNAAILDTRGYILHLLGREEEALTDLNAAVQGMDSTLEKIRLRQSASRQPAETHLDPGAGPQTIQKASGPKKISELYNSELRNAAVGHYHRAQVLAALDRQEEAEADLAVVRQLIGREPDETLY